eukprot:79000-Rhodomonas_salina.1
MVTLLSNEGSMLDNFGDNSGTFGGNADVHGGGHRGISSSSPNTATSRSVLGRPRYLARYFGMVRDARPVPAGSVICGSMPATAKQRERKTIQDEKAAMKGSDAVIFGSEPLSFGGKAVDLWRAGAVAGGGDAASEGAQVPSKSAQRQV